MFYAGSRTGKIQSNLNSSNTDGSFTMANSNSILSPYEILPLGQENKSLWKFSYFIMKLYVVCTHLNCLIKAILMSILKIQLLCRKWKKKIPKLLLFASWPGAMINPQWLELPTYIQAIWVTLSGSNYPDIFKPLRIDCTYNLVCIRRFYKFSSLLTA